MSEYTQDEAVAFIESLRLTVANRVGFRWMTEKLSALSAYVENLAAENKRLNAYVDRADLRKDYESYVVTHPDDASGAGGGSSG